MYVCVREFVHDKKECVRTYTHVHLDKRANMVQCCLDEAESLVAVIHGRQWVVPAGGKPLKSTCEVNFI